MTALACGLVAPACFRMLEDVWSSDAVARWRSPAGGQAVCPAERELYQQFCLACHQPDGRGLPGIFPPLARSDYLLADKTRAIRGLIQGQSGEMVVNGKNYHGFMPPVPLDDGQIATVLTYVLNAWGNAGGFVSDEQVRQVRASGAPTPAVAASGR